MSKIAIKVGSNLLVDNCDGHEVINYGFILDLAGQIAELRRQGHSVLLVTSGAVASDPRSHRSKNLRAAIGQSRLMSVYTQCFREHGVKDVAQILLTDHDFRYPKVLKATVAEAFGEGVQVVINANDPVNNKELMNMVKCEDNDRLTAKVARALGLDFVLFGIDKPGLLDNDGEVVHRVTLAEYVQVIGYAKGGSQHGHGDEGMKTKLEQLFKLVSQNIDAILLPAREPEAFLRATEAMLSRSAISFGTIFSLE